MQNPGRQSNLDQSTYCLPFEPFDHNALIGTVSEIGRSTVEVLLPSRDKQSVSPHDIGGFVVVESGDYGIFGRITDIHSYKRKDPSEPLQSVASIQLLNSIDLKRGGVYAGVKRLPRIEDQAYVANPKLIQWIVESKARRDGKQNPVMLSIARLSSAEEVPLRFTPEMLFGRHCAVVGSTGGGKSWTLARMVEEAARFRAKVILFDASGEFSHLSRGVKHIYLGQDPEPAANAQEVVVPYFELTERDLFAIFQPTGSTQAPKLRAAIKTLKLAYLEPEIAPGGAVVKANKLKRQYENAYRKHAEAIENPYALFDIRKLNEQILNECVHPYRSELETHTWGENNAADKARCVTLITRIEDITSSPNLLSIFYPQGKRSLMAEIDKFLKTDEHRVLNISLKYLAYDHHAREIVTNSIGRKLLEMARTARFKQQPVLLVLDEAHQFLNHSLSDEEGEYPLDSFAVIAKEGRKYALNICLATQRPRDIPEGVLSQIGTFIVHRLTNDRDRFVIERASSDLDRHSLGSLPALSPGEALIVGNDFPIPLTVKITPPESQPDSAGPDFQRFWR